MPIARPRRPHAALLALLALAACRGTAGGPDTARGPEGARTAAASGFATVDSVRLLADVEFLSHDTRAGRRLGTPGNADARLYLSRQLAEIGAQPVAGGVADTPYAHAFRAARRGAAAGDSVTGYNVVAQVRGTRTPDRVLVVSAHYDHVGIGRPVNGDSIYNGADDNASGTAALLAVARELVARPPEHTVILLWPDGEEMGLLGARAFVANPPVPKASIAMNVNFDMISRDVKGELWIAGPTKWPKLRPLADRLAADAPVSIRIGHDSGSASYDWTSQSDQGAFHAAGIPFLYFGVEDHPDYHKPSDSFERLTRGFYVRAARTVIEAVRRADHCLPVLTGSGAAPAGCS
ncbi:M28 family peptidase [Roseisolibacter agri]|uniref:M28 family peptidase n=1 Tax=Roseisolibacter agri TaxID=2014610 RepID=UPI0024E053E7|nr:M28 family peptidase [Roseisolibacter agri]